MDNKAPPEPEKKFEAGNDQHYMVETIIDSAVYGQ